VTRLRDINPQTLVKPFRDQHTAAEEARQDFEQARAERDPYLVFLQELPEASEGAA
jgi:hypothetical protein